MFLAEAAAADDVRPLALPTNDLLYDRFTQRIYASIPGSVPAIGNTITAIDPVTGSLGPSVFIGSQPSRLAISDGGEFLYVGLNGSGSVRRLHLPTRAPGIEFFLGGDLHGAYLALSMAVVPGHPESVAVVRYQPGVSGTDGIVIYDDGVPRPKATGTYEGGFSIGFGPSAARLYGMDGRGLYTMAVDGFGVSVLDFADGLSGWNSPLRIENGLVYGADGFVVDLEARMPAGRYSGIRYDGALTVPDAGAGRVFMLLSAQTPSRDAHVWTLVAYDQRTFTRVGSLPIPGVSGDPTTLIRWGTDGLAFRTTAGQLFLIRSSLVSARVTPRQRIAIFRPTTGQWFLREDDGSATTVSFGKPGDVPVPADYFGLGRAEVALFRPALAQWSIRTDVGWPVQVTFGSPGDLPVPADLLGLGHAPFAVFRPATAEWRIRQDDGTTVVRQFGAPGDLPVPADYLGLKHPQIAVFRPATSEWFVRREDGTALRVQWGGPGDQPVPGDYLGLGHAQIGVYRPATGEWFLRDDAGGLTRIQFGGAGDRPIPGDYEGSGRTQIAVFRPSTEEWFLRSTGGTVSRIQWGGIGDLPVPAAYSPSFGMLPSAP